MILSRTAILRAASAMAIASVALRSQAAPIEVHVDLNPTETYTSHAATHHDGGSARCRGEPHAENFPPIEETVALAGGNGKFSSDARAVCTANARAYGHGLFAAGNLSLRMQFSKPERETGAAGLQISISEKIFQKYHGDDGFDCGHTAYSAYHRRAAISGKLTLRYRVPDGIWLLKAKLSVPAILKNVELKISETVYHNSGPINGHEISMWVKPGSDVDLSFQFQDFEPGQDFDSAIEWSVRPVIADTLPLEALTNLRGGNLDAYVAGALHPRDAMATARDEEKLAVLAMLVRSPDLRKRIIRGNRSEVLEQFLSRSLYGLEMSPGHARERSSQGAQKDLKMLASLAAFYLAKDVLQEMVPFCEMTQAETPIRGQTVSVRGVALAWYYLKTALNRLEYYNFANYSAIFSEIMLYEKAELTYDQVMQDAAKQSSLQRAYRALTVMDLSKMPFGEALADLDFVLNKFVTVGTSQEEMAQIKSILGQLASQEKPFVRAAVARFAQFRKGNTERVRISDLVRQLDAISAAQGQVVRDMKTKIAFLSFDPNSVQRAGDFTQKMIQKNVNILRAPIKGSGTDVLAFERVRQALIASQAGLDELERKANQCSE